MGTTVIKVENVGKQYRLGMVGTGTISHDLRRWWYRVRGWEDPYLKIGEANDRTKKGDSDLVWALRDINFEVKQGEVLGIIGRNGAGKSTLLKLLSRVTQPTTGNIKVRGRIASLLEVGTGFHPELSGRENIFLNGAILGMTKAEIRSKFDEIVDFSGVERYIDTPVKRYSSGMYVRLAFAVAAHLEPEILIIDEVLAVGDAEFQKKCLGKMKDVSGQGRTVLFVSHNMVAVKTLCTSGFLLVNGTMAFSGSCDDAVTEYLKLSYNAEMTTFRRYSSTDAPTGTLVKVLGASICDMNGENIDGFNVYDSIRIVIDWEIFGSGGMHYPNLHFFNEQENCVLVASVNRAEAQENEGIYATTFIVPPYTFNTGVVRIGVAITTYPGMWVQLFVNPMLTVRVEEMNLNLRDNPYTGPIPGETRVLLQHQTIKI
ncbi:MAG: ABC transporter ATP-binding protein [Flavobacteriales bacterium]